MKIQFLTIGFLLGLALCHLGQPYVKYDLIDEIQIKSKETDPNVQTLLISEANTVLLISDNQIVAYDIKTLSHISQINIKTESKIKQVNYIIVENSESLYIVILMESQQFKYFKFYTLSQVLVQQKQMIISPLLYPIIYDLNINTSPTPAPPDQLPEEDENKFIFILESHSQVEQVEIQRNSLSIMKYNKNTQLIDAVCSITYQYGQEELQVKCRDAHHAKIKQKKFMIDCNQTYILQRQDSQNYIFFYNKFELASIHIPESLDYNSLLDQFNMIQEQTIMTEEEFKQLNFCKMSFLNSQEAVFIYWNDRELMQSFYIIRYNILAQKNFRIDQVERSSQIQQKHAHDAFSINIMYYNKIILIQSKYEFFEISFPDQGNISVKQNLIGTHSFSGFSDQNKFLELSYIHEGQIVPFAISKSQSKNNTYNLFLQNCMANQIYQSNGDKEIYFANEFSCRKLSCSSHLIYQSKFDQGQPVCLLLDIQKERKYSPQSSSSWYKISLYVLGSLLLILGMKQVIKNIKNCLNKIRSYCNRNITENKNLIQKDISEKESDGESCKMREEQYPTSQNYEMAISSPKVQSTENNYSEQPLNQMVIDLKSQSSGSSNGLKKYSSSQNGNENNIGITPTSNEDDVANNLLQKQNSNGLKDSYYKQSQLYYQQIQKEEKIKKLMLQQNEKQLIEENIKKAKQQIQFSKSAQYIPSDNLINPQVYVANNKMFQGNNVVPNQNQMFHQNNQFYNQNPFNMYNNQQKVLGSIEQQQQQYFFNQNQQNPSLQIPDAEPTEPKLNGQFDLGYSAYIPQQIQNQLINNNQLNPQNQVNNGFDNNVSQNQLKNIQASNQFNQDMKNTQLNITQQLKFFQWALDQQFGFNKLNQDSVPHLIGDNLLLKSQYNSSKSNESNQSQQISDEQQLLQSLSSFQQFLSMELGDSSQVNNKPFILSHSQIEKLTQSLHQQYEIYKNSGINQIEQKSESEVFQLFIKNELQSDFVIEEANKLFQQQVFQNEDGLKSTGISNDAESNNSIQSQQNQVNNNQDNPIPEEQKQENDENESKKYQQINFALKKQKSLEIIEVQPLNKIDSQNPQNDDDINQNNKNEVKQDLINKEDARFCQICLENEKDSAYKCGHRYCYKCALQVKQKFGQCSFCKFEIDDIIKLYN